MDALERLFRHAPPSRGDIEEFMQAMSQELLHYAYVLTGTRDGAEDAVQDLLVTLLSQGEALRKIEKPRAWLFTVLRRKALANRGTQSLTERSLAHQLSEAVEVDPSQRLILKEAFEMLAPDAQEITLLHLWEGLTFSEVADVLQIPLGTVLSCYHRGMHALRQKLGETNVGPEAEEELQNERHTQTFPR